MSESHRTPATLSRGDYSASPGADSAQRVPAECAGLRLDQALAWLYPEHSRNRLQDWVRQGRVRVDGRCVEPRHKVWGGERLEVEPEAAALETEDAPEAIPLAVAFEDEALIVIDKPAGLVVHPGSGNRSGTLLNALLHHEPRLAGLPRAGIVHRLDKDTSGLLVVARSLAAQTELVRQLQARSVSRRYLAVVRGEIERKGSVDAPLGRHPAQRTRMAVVAGGREARTHYAPRERFSGATLIECALETGRTHQIRVHMASIGHPLLGDPVYGGRRSAGPAIARQALHAWRLGLRHPVSAQAMEWTSPPPADFERLIEALRRARG